MKNIRQLIGLLIVASASLAAKPNIVFLLADDMNRDTWGVYGSKDCKTPNIDRLAKDGLTFTKAYCSVAMCAPFRQELYSGQSPWRTGTLANHSKSKAGTRSIPHYLKPLGYRVALSGKSHVGPAPCYPFEKVKGGNNQSFVEGASGFFEDCKKSETPFCLFIASHDGHAPFTTGDPKQYDADKLTVPPYWLDTPLLRETLTKYYAEITNFDALVGQIRALLEEKGLFDNTILAVCSEQGVQFPFAKWTCYNNGLNTGLVMSWPGIVKPGGRTDTLVSTRDITPTFVEAAGGKLADTDCEGLSFLPTLKGESQVLHDYVYGAFTNCNIIDNRSRIYPIRVIRSREFSLIYNPEHKDGLTSNVTLTAVLNELHSGAKSSKSSSHPATSWLPLKGSSAKADALITKLNARPEYELYHLANDPHELHNQANNPEYQDVFAKMKTALSARLTELGDTDPVATEKALVKGQGNGSKKKKKKDKK